MIGDTTVLLCMTFGQADDDIVWTHNGERLTNSSLVSITSTDFIQDGLVFRQSFLRICNVSRNNSGSYSCVASTDVAASTRITAVTGNC